MTTMPQPTMEELRAKLAATTGPYGAEPGSGPSGKTCRDCAFLKNTGNPGMKAHYKCGKTKYTSGDKTTIRVRTKACRLFQQWEPKIGYDHGNE